MAHAVALEQEFSGGDNLTAPGKMEQVEQSVKNVSIKDHEASQPDNTKALEQVFSQLKAKDDTSRFVGLSLLRSILDANDDLRTDEATIKKCWSAVPNNFLIRLLKPGKNDDAKNMNDLAVAVIHTFANLLPANEVVGQKMLEVLLPLRAVLDDLSSATQMLAFQTLQCLVSTPAGAHTLSRFQGADLLDRGVDQEDVRYWREWIKLHDLAFSVAHDKERKKHLKNLLVLKFSFIVVDRTFCSPLVLELWADLVPTLQVRELVSEPLHLCSGLTNYNQVAETPEFLSKIFAVVQINICPEPAKGKKAAKPPSAQARTAAIKLTSHLLQHAFGPIEHIGQPWRIFDGAMATPQGDKPFSYIFAQYILIDLRSTIPTLMTNLASPSYQHIALRLAACYDVVTGLIRYLMELVDRDEVVMSADPLLKLRKSLSETFSLTLGFFRDRWDAVITGASGLDPSARTDPKAPRMLTWDNPTIPPEGDPIVLSGLRALAVWVREDDNSDLNAQALGIMDMLIALYQSSQKADATVDFRPPILMIFEALMIYYEEATKSLLENGGWDMFFTHLKAELARDLNNHTIDDLVGVMLNLVYEGPQSREAWMGVVKVAADLDLTPLQSPPRLGDENPSIESVYELVLAVLESAPTRLQKLVRNDVIKLQKHGSALVKHWWAAFELAPDGVADGAIETLEYKIKKLGKYTGK